MGTRGLVQDQPRAAPPGGDLADQAERAGTQRTPFLALAGVWLTVAIVAGVLVAVALVLYFVV
jgi:hypothetical protein